MKKYFLISLIFIIIIFFLVCYPHLEFYSKNYLYMFSYSNDMFLSEDYSELEQEFCYGEIYSYNKERDISTKSWNYNSFLFFKWFKVEYQEGNVCDTEFLLEESYINDFLERANIKVNEDNLNIKKLIEGKKAIIGNTRYSMSENYSYIEYELDGEYKEMYIYEINELLVIQVGLSDEGPKFIAYK